MTWACTQLIISHTYVVCLTAATVRSSQVSHFSQTETKQEGKKKKRCVFHLHPRGSRWFGSNQICVSLTITATVFECQRNPNEKQKDGNCFQFFCLKGCLIGSWASHSAQKRCQHGCSAIWFLFASPPASPRRSPKPLSIYLILDWPFMKRFQIASCFWSRGKKWLALLDKSISVPEFWDTLMTDVSHGSLVFFFWICLAKAFALLSRDFHRHKMCIRASAVTAVFKWLLLNRVSGKTTPSQSIYPACLRPNSSFPCRAAVMLLFTSCR